LLTTSIYFKSKLEATQIARCVMYAYYLFFFCGWQYERCKGWNLIDAPNIQYFRQPAVLLYRGFHIDRNYRHCGLDHIMCIGGCTSGLCALQRSIFIIYLIFLIHNIENLYMRRIDCNVMLTIQKMILLCSIRSL